MIWFYRDFLDGFVYIIVVIISLIFIMAIIGFIMERKKTSEEEKNRIAVLSNEVLTTNSHVEPAIATSVTSTPVSVVNPAPVQNDTTESVSSVVSGQSVIPQEVIEKSQSAVTNSKIPEVLDFNKIEIEQLETDSLTSQNQQ